MKKRILDYQAAWLNDDSRFKIWLAHRQSRKTWTTALEVVTSCFEAEQRGEKTTWVILSRGERQSKEVMESAIKPHCRVRQMVMEDLEYEWTESDDSPISYRVLEVRFPNGSRILALPANPDTARGFSGNVWLDEFAFHQDSRKIWAALYPIINNGYKIRITSTPNGRKNKFYDLWTSTKCVWSKHFVDIIKSVALGLDIDIEEIKAGLDDDLAWEQEYLCKFLDEATAYLSFDLINSAERDFAGKPNLYAGGSCFLGLDLARRRDLSVFWLWEEVGSQLITRELLRLRGVSFAEQRTVLERFYDQYDMHGAAIDETGLGMEFAEWAAQKFGAIPVNFTPSATRQRLAEGLKNRLTDGTAILPQGDRDLRYALAKIKRVAGDNDGWRFVADRDSRGHADEFWAGALGIDAAKTPPLYRSAYGADENARHVESDNNILMPLKVQLHTHDQMAATTIERTIQLLGANSKFYREHGLVYFDNNGYALLYTSDLELIRFAIVAQGYVRSAQY
jgi:phage FluMu gp28-like protein